MRARLDALLTLTMLLAAGLVGLIVWAVALGIQLFNIIKVEVPHGAARTPRTS